MFAIDDLSKVYGDGMFALANISLNLSRGELVVILGASGCGKTTLLRLMAGLDVPSAGSIRLREEIVAEPHPAIGLVFQEPRLLPWLDIAGNVGFGIRDLPAAERDRRIAGILRDVGLADHAGRWPRELSGGQQQRASLARALAAGPEVLLLDEPFSALDARTRTTLQDHLVGLWQKQGLTIVLVTHDVEEAVFLADRVIVMEPHPGRVFDSVELGLLRPRDRESPVFADVVRDLRRRLDLSLTPAA
jgi:sulfonate transport system ATP-binding protein